MKGPNSLHLNEATIVEAIQEYLDKRMTAFSPKVVSVRIEEGHGYEGRRFIVDTADRTTKEEPRSLP